ncbi:MAG TPA: sulfotransferase [Solirubrobacteraceae bacterium]|nr:sulfotransferase [Solirubrobacteraceae bacterium]
MKLIGAGMPRTATLTQKIALEMLGLGPCYHMVDVLADLEQAALWERALDGEGPWEEVFAGYNSTVDWPGGYFYRELIDVYPEAKVLLSVREPQAWAASMRETVWAVRHGESLIRLLSSAQAHVNPQWQGFVDMIDRLLWQGQGTFASGNETPEQLIGGMERHNEEVRRSVPPERLLVWTATEGWEPLCEFLELPVPDMAFPHVNDRTEFLGRVIDGSLQALTEWRQRQESVEPSFAIRAAEGI